MRPDPPIHSIAWGRKFSLKDRTPQFVIVFFIIALMVLFRWFSGVSNECHEETIGNDQNFIEKYF